MAVWRRARSTCGERPCPRRRATDARRAIPRRPIGLGVNVEGRIGGGDALGWQFGGVRGQRAESVHVPGGEQLTLVGPSLGAAGGAHAEEAAAGLENFQTVAMLDGGYCRRLQGNVATDLEGGGTNEGFADRLCARRCFRTAAEQEQSGYHAYLCYGTWEHPYL